jgi:hypothetical protein
MEFATFKSEKFEEQLNALSDVLIGKGIESDPAVILADEARLFLKQAIRLTPPKTKAQGEQAIQDDLSRIFSGGNKSFLEHVIEITGKDHDIQHWFTNKRGEKYLMDVNYISPDGDGMYQFHQKNRTKRGRTTTAGQFTRDIGRWKEHNKMIVGYAERDRYFERTKARVGMRKSGWAQAYLEMGGKLPKWISDKLKYGLGKVQNNLHVQGHPSVVMSSHARGVMEDERIIKDTFRARGEAIAKRIRLIVSGYAKDVKEGIKISRKAHRTAD